MKDATWLEEPELHDYDAAQDYLELIFRRTTAAGLVAGLRDNGTQVQRKAKDIIRASHLRLLKKSDPSVAHDLRKIDAGHALSPILLVVDLDRQRLIIADGYHRVCAAYRLDENTEVPARIITTSRRANV